MVPNFEPKFDWSWQGVLKRAAQTGMDGYTPNVSNATSQMQNYAPTPEPSVVDAGTQGGAVNRGAPGVAAEQQAHAEAQRQERIRELKSKIEFVQNRLAQNMARLKNSTESAEAIGALEAQKINSKDPTMVWRWQKQREDTAKANDRALGNAGKNWKNTESMYLDQMMSSSNAGLEQQIRNFENAIREGKNYGQDTTALEKRKMEYEQILANGGPQGVRAQDDFDKAAADPNADTEALLGMIPSLTRDKQADAIKRIFDLKEKQAKKAEENKKKYDAQVRSRAIKLAGGEKKWKRLSPAYQQTLLDQAKMPGVK